MNSIPDPIAALGDTVAGWRQDIHQHPELAYEEHRTAQLVAKLLHEFGFDEVTEGMGGTGVVGVLRSGKSDDRDAIMLRADTDAIKADELTNLNYASRTPGVFHGCGHDGHTAMLLGAAKHMAETRNFSGTVYFLFSPAEEGGAGIKAMIDDGLLRKYPPRAVYGLHNWPGRPIGEMAVKPGRVLAAVEIIRLSIKGKGAHGGEPHLSRDPLLAGAHLVTALQSIVSRVVPPQEPAVLSITKFVAGLGQNVIPDEAHLEGTMRCYSLDVQKLMHDELERIVANAADMFGVEISMTPDRTPYVPTINDTTEATFCHDVMTGIIGPEKASNDHIPVMAGEDFGYLSNVLPAAYAIIGNGDTAALHNPAYDFSDEIIPLGITYWTRLVETALPKSKS